MNSENVNTFGFNEKPENGDKEGWAKYADEAEKFVKEHSQTGERSYSTFGEDLAVRGLNKFLSASKRMSKMQGLGAPEVILQHENNMLMDAMNDINTVDHESISRLRGNLAGLPDYAKRLQNQIFTGLMDGHNDSFLLERIKPDEKKIAWGLGLLVADRSDQYKWYDFIDKLTEKDDNDEPVVSDELFKNFFEWYQTSLAKRQHELNSEKEKSISDYCKGVEGAVKDGRLPKSFMENLNVFDPNSPRSRNLNISLFDAMIGGSGILGSIRECVSIDREAPIGVRADVAIDRDKELVVWHEFTHAISGDIIDFGDHEANRIVNEALTEHLSVMILSYSAGIDPDEIESEFMDGHAYKNERSAVKWLSSGGEKEIAPEMFYEAYAEYDPEYEFDMHDGEVIKPKVGPKKQALFAALLEAFPECKNVKDLGMFIKRRFETDSSL